MTRFDEDCRSMIRLKLSNPLLKPLLQGNVDENVNPDTSIEPLTDVIDKSRNGFELKNNNIF